MQYLVKNITGNFDPSFSVVRAFPNRFWLCNGEATEFIVPEELADGIRYFDYPNGKKLRANFLGSDVAVIETGPRFLIDYSAEQLSKRLAFKQWLVLNVYVKDMKDLGIPVPIEQLNLIENSTSNTEVDALIIESFYYDL